MKTPECMRCGSEKIMYNVPLQDQGQYASPNYIRPAEVVVHGNPSAWFDKEAATGQLSLKICGDCGYAEMYVKNFRELYEKCVQSQPKPQA